MTTATLDCFASPQELHYQIREISLILIIPSIILQIEKPELCVSDLPVNARVTTKTFSEISLCHFHSSHTGYQTRYLSSLVVLETFTTPAKKFLVILLKLFNTVVYPDQLLSFFSRRQDVGDFLRPSRGTLIHFLQIYQTIMSG